LQLAFGFREKKDVDAGRRELQKRKAVQTSTRLSQDGPELILFARFRVDGEGERPVIEKKKGHFLRLEEDGTEEEEEEEWVVNGSKSESKSCDLKSSS
jgi:hypothetical protein